ncbi:MAG: ATP-grasp domain-containing protein [Gaiellaceae bacterium]
MSAAATPGAIVVGGDYQGLGIIRSLGRKGIPTCVVDDERSVGSFSRYATHSLHVADLRDPEAAVEATLLAARRFGLDGWVLFPTRDEHVATFALERERLGQVLRVPTPEWEVVKWACDKRNTYARAEELDIPTPRTWRLEAAAQLDEVEGEPPWAVKPAIKDTFVHETKEKAWRANSRDELRRLVERAAELVGPGEVIVQELIPGGGESQYAYCAFFRDGEPLASMVAQRRRQHPLEFGRASTYVRTVELETLEELACRFLRSIGYYGLVELEFKLDPRDGRAKLLDVNARTWGYHTLGSCAGVDFPYLLYLEQIGEPVPTARAIAGRSWVRLVTDLPTGVLEIFSRRTRLRDYIWTLRTSDTEAVFARDDLLPGFVELALIPYLAVRRGF